MLLGLVSARKGGRAALDGGRWKKKRLEIQFALLALSIGMSRMPFQALNCESSEMSDVGHPSY